MEETQIQILGEKDMKPGQNPSPEVGRGRVHAARVPSRGSWCCEAGSWREGSYDHNHRRLRNDHKRDQHHIAGFPIHLTV